MCGHCILGQFHYQKQRWDNDESFIETAKSLCFDTPGCGMFYVKGDSNRQDAFLCSTSTPVIRNSGATTYVMSK